MEKKKILIIDDQGALKFVVKFDLEKAGFSVVTAGDGKQGIEVAREEKPDLIILDVVMPVMDGFEACRRLKNMEETKDIPIMFLTAKAKEEEMRKGLEYGAADYMLKPFNFKDLFKKIIELIGKP